MLKFCAEEFDCGGVICTRKGEIKQCVELSVLCVLCRCNGIIDRKIQTVHFIVKWNGAFCCKGNVVACGVLYVIVSSSCNKLV